MPRPKRSKVGPSSIPKHVSSPQPTTNSDDSDGLVTRNKNGKTGTGTVRREFMMSGALPAGDVGATRIRRPTGRKVAALSRIAREADHATRAIEALRMRKDEATARAQRGAQDKTVVSSSVPAEIQVARSQASVEVELVKPGTVTPPPAPPSVLKARSTPLAEVSVLALAKFKRRPRQPSILQIGRPDDTVSLSGLSDDLDDLGPEVESTPIQGSERQQAEGIKIDESPPLTPAQMSPSTVGSRKRKLPLSEIQVPRSRSPTLTPTEQRRRQDGNDFAILSDVSTSPEPTLPASGARRSPSPTRTLSDILAPPQSSSPSRPESSAFMSGQSPPSNRPRRGRPLGSGAASSKPTRNPSPLTRPLQPLPTATLQNLLPRRRRKARPRSEFDMMSSDDTTGAREPGSDDDELSFAAPSKKSGRPGAARRARRASGSAKTPVKRARKAKPKRTEKETGKRKGAPSAVTTKTYSRRMSDKENHVGTSGVEEDDNAGAEICAEGPKELKVVAQKFAEVDEWEMEFEEATASSSSLHGDGG